MSECKIIDGKAYAQLIHTRIAKNVAELKDKKHIIPGLAVILVGSNPASQVYVSNKATKTREAKMNSFEFILPEDISEDKLLEKIYELNQDSNIHGILVQLPLPKHINENKIINAITPEKDVDGFTTINVGKLAIGQQDAMIPCTPKGCIMLLKSVLHNLEGLNAVVIGRSNIVGKPMAQLLLKENCTVTITHSKSKNIEHIVKNADIVVAAVGIPNFVKGSWLKKGATIIDVGINRVIDNDNKSKLVGDVDFASAKEIAGFITPVPGGVGPMTIACLLENTLIAATNVKN